MAIETGDTISLPVLSQFIEVPGAEGDTEETGDSDFSAAMARFEREYLKDLLRKCGGNLEDTARESGMNLATIYRKLKKHDLRKEDYC